MTRFERFIISLPPVAWLLRQSKKVFLPGSQGVPLYDVLIFFVQQVKKIGFNERAAAISFNFLMAIPAGMIFLFTLVPYLPVSKEFTRELLIAVHDILQNKRTFDLVSTVIRDVLTTPRSGLLSFSFLFALFFASNAMMGVMRTFDRSFFEERKRKFMYKRWTAIKLTFLLLLLVFVSILLLTTQGPIKKSFHHRLGLDNSTVAAIVNYSRWVIIIMLNFFSIAFIYKYATAVKIKWRTFSPGAIMASLLTIFTSYIFSMWVNNFGRYNQVYGSIGTLIIIMNLVYINALILLIGFEINVSITTIKSRYLQRKANEIQKPKL
ncbi:MAG: YihY/virulence factor BrkB family protein [Chitinophagaceae bacterium]